jgi:hypothetical protein
MNIDLRPSTCRMIEQSPAAGIQQLLHFTHCSDRHLRVDPAVYARHALRDEGRL